LTPAELSRGIKSRAAFFGFDLVGIAPASPPPHAQALDAWLASGFGGKLSYLSRRREELQKPERLMPHAKSVISCAISYRPSPETWPLVGKHPVSCFAWGRDYHLVLREKLASLALYIESLVPGTQTRLFTDSGPLLEKSFAQKAGLGQVGKNTLLLNPDFGSFLFLGEILTDLALEFDEPFTRDLCGTCRKCLEACPTGALVGERELDARKCVSYRTQRKENPPPETDFFNGMIWGCDLCQKACPYNEKAFSSREKAFRPKPEITEMTVSEISALSDEELRNRLRESALENVNPAVLKRNASFAAHLAKPQTGTPEN